MGKLQSRIAFCALKNIDTKIEHLKLRMLKKTHILYTFFSRDIRNLQGFMPGLLEIYEAKFSKRRVCIFLTILWSTACYIYNNPHHSKNMGW